ncbi:oligosaccharide repeat unit polymerase [Allofrancisella guangzhouensis]|uniref:O-antigen polymerase n=1 Tax=Allofrancisella guangzhouensis TaxID=594679 RepID=UPI001904FBE2|nr:O-antigen polymerase [Allofrancisella guangzhouensis]MBK2044948.1 oligosaccharide repeat unit polymerase [Allofrancisella guangzhouensis]
MLKDFLIVWCVYWVLVLILPLSSIYEHVYMAFLFQLSFVFFVFLGYKAVSLSSYKSTEVYFYNRIDLLKRFNLMITISLWISFIGCLFLLYDKIYIQHIDYFKGLAIAREQWRVKGLDRGGSISSIYSVIGYFFSSGYYLAGVLFVICAKQNSFKRNFLIIISIFLLLLFNCFMTGGRSNILLLASYILGARLLINDRGFKGIFRNRVLRKIFYLFTLLSVIYIVYIFSQRAIAGDKDLTGYLESFLPWLGLELSSKEFLNYDNFLSDVISALLLVLSYITHSFSTMVAIIQHDDENKFIIFISTLNSLNKLGLIPSPDTNWFLAGRFPSLPGAFLYQFGYVGFFFASFLLGALSGLAKRVYCSKSSSILYIGFFVSMYSVLVLSPLLLASDFMSFPFVCIIFLFISVIFKIRIRI